MSEHIDIPLEVVDNILGNVMAGKTKEAMDGLRAIRDLLRNPDIRSIFEINATVLINHQHLRIAELENAADRFAKDVVSHADSDPVLFCRPFFEWMKDSKAQYLEKVKDLIKHDA